MLIRAADIRLQTAVQHKIGVFQGPVVNQVVQLRALKHIVGNLIFYGDGVDGTHGAIGKVQLNAGGVHVKFTAENTVSRDEQISRITQLRDFISRQTTNLTEFDEALVKRWVQKITVQPDRYTVELKSGLSVDIEG